MSTRPDILFPLFAGLDSLDGVGPKTAAHFANIHVEKPRDLLFLLPYSGTDRRMRDTVAGVPAGEVATVTVTVKRHSPARARGRPYRVFVDDGQIEFPLVFFHANDRYLTAQLPEGARRVISGKLEWFDGTPQIVHPDHIVEPDAVDGLPDYEPVYPLTAGVTQKVMARAVRHAVRLAPDLAEWIDPSLMRREGWPSWTDALHQAHNPQATGDLSPETPARQRLAYDELFAHQLTLALARADQRRATGKPTVGDGTLRGKVLKSLAFAPTGAQTRAIGEITADLAAPYRMNRLLQGDVGSGKTLVALMALLTAVEAGGQGVMMAPTEILARQHLDSILPLAEAAGVVVAVLTGRDKGKERQSKLAALARGDIHILIGTHAVFQKDVEFRDLRLA
ncbi:MAG: DEAD/DEAH box helicase, partial [Pseudomonadota bacterium]|nr:DEAD/DEAH box helicase [Pseudomonadota bacterium]